MKFQCVDVSRVAYLLFINSLFHMVEFDAFARSNARSVRAEYQNPTGFLVSEYLFRDGMGGDELAKTIHLLGGKIFVIRKKLDSVSVPGIPLQFLKIEHDSIWLRDFAPLSIQVESERPIFLDFRYEGSLEDDRFPLELGRSLEVPVKSGNLFLDGGNIQVANGRCFLSEVEQYRNGAGEPIAKREYLRLLGKSLGCQPILLAGLPHPHIDMWLKTTGDSYAFVASVEPGTLELSRKLQPPSESEKLSKLKYALDRASEQVSKFGRKVFRIPQPLIEGNLLRSYTNSLVIGKTWVVPRYRRKHITNAVETDYADFNLLLSYEKTITNVLKTAGYKVTFLNADRLIARGGGWHCVVSEVF